MKALGELKALALIGAVLLALYIAAGFMQPRQKAPSQPPPDKWVYGKSIDQMRGTTSHYAFVHSNEVPQGEEKPFDLVLWEGPDGKATARMDGDASFDSCFFLGSPPVEGKFDDQPVEKFECDEGNGTIFFKSADMVDRIRRAKKLTVEVRLDLNDKPVQQITFDLDGLKWPPPRDASGS